LRQIEQVLLQRRGGDVDYQPEVLEMIGKQLRDAKRTKRCLESETMRLPASSDCRQEMEFLLQLYGEQLQSYEEDLSVLQPEEALLGSSSHSSTSSRSSFRNQAFDYNNYLSSSERFRLTSVPSSQSINTSTSDSSTGRSGRTYRRPAVVGDGMRTSL
jgi:hypothetical protein